MRRLLLALGLSMAIASTASAITCRDWDRLGPGEKNARIDALIQQAVQGSGGRQYTSVQRGSVERCLRGQAGAIANEFDDACARGDASMGALRGIFKNHVWSCVR